MSTPRRKAPEARSAEAWLALEKGCNAHAAQLGFLEAGAAEFAARIPLILKLNNS